MKQIGVKIVSLPNGRTPEEAVKKILDEDRDALEYAEVDALFAPAYVPNDPKYGTEWHLPKIGVPTAWDTTKGDGVTIAILDSGVNCTHPDLVAHCVPGWNVANNNSDTTDLNGHGTMVAGTALSVGDNTLGGVGVAYESKIMPVRLALDSTGSSSCSAIGDGIIYAIDNGAKVASNSYWVIGCSVATDAANYMASKGGIYVRAMGNDSSLVTTPGDLNIIHVGATDSNDVKTSWSNYGPQVDVVAPGTPIYCTPGSGYSTCWGTSFSVPIVSGVLGLMFSANPNLKADQARSILFSTAKDLGTTGRDDLYGYGRVDAAAAVAAALTTTAPVTDTTAPTVPTSLTSVHRTLDISLSWTASGDNVAVTGYNIFRNGAKIGTSTTASYVDKSISSGATYSYTVSAYDAAGNTSAQSASVSVTTAVIFTLSSVTARSDSTTMGTVSVTTNLPSTVTVKYGTSKTNLSMSVVGNISSTTHQVNITGLTKKTRYYYQVIASNSQGELLTSAVQNFMTKTR